MKVQGSTIIPSLRYHDAHAAIDWLVRVVITETGNNR